MQKIKITMKRCFLLLFVCSLYLTAAAQKQNTYFLKKNGDYVTILDSADYIRIVQEPEKGSSLYPTKEYYRSGKKKNIGYSTKIDPPKYEGQYISFYENGNRKKLAYYEEGKVTDTVYNYYPNGKLYTATAFFQMKDNVLTSIKTMKDSTGVELVTNGSGLGVIYDDDFQYVMGKGKSKNGSYDGEWTGELRAKDTLTYKETYVDGKMLSGESNDGKGNVYQYTVSEVQPTFKGGMDAFYRSLVKSVRYPANMVSQNEQGVARIKFVIEKNGDISDVHVVNQVQPEFAAEAVRVLKLSKGWQPGVQKGRKVRVSYVVPVSFSLGNK